MWAFIWDGKVNQIKRDVCCFELKKEVWVRFTLIRSLKLNNSKVCIKYKRQK